MSGLFQCPSCKENIDDDSHYCDQCGEQVFICSSCGRPGKGKRCIFDGKEMIPAGAGAAQSQATAQPQQPVQQQPAPSPAAAPSAAPVHSAPSSASLPSAAPAPQSTGDKIKLTSGNSGVNIEVSNGDTLGRTKGPFAGVLGRFSHISGAHCKFHKTAAGWSIEDLGSTNGTFYNNSRLAPNVPVSLQSGTSVKLADLDLLITYNSADGGTQRI